MKQFVSGVAVGLIGALALFPAVKAASPADYKSLDLFGEALERVYANYLQNVTIADLVHNAIDGMMAGLDPHSYYIDAKEYAGLRNPPSDAIADVGISFKTEYGRVKILSFANGSPAIPGDIEVGDHILSIGGRPVDGLSRFDIISMMRGAKDSKVTLTIQREFGQKPWDVSLARNVVTVEDVKYERKGDIGYIRVSSFANTTESHLKDAVASLKSQIGPGLKGYILDLRDNQGGLFTQSIAVSDDFLDAGQIVSVRGRNPSTNEAHTAQPGDIADGKPVIVLINGGSAAASEIVAGALQDNHRATILGMKSFGEGTVQTIIPLAKGEGGALRLTTAEYYKPSGGEIQATGITPDVAVAQLAANDSGGNAEHMSSEAQLPGHFPAASQSNQTSSPVIYPDKKYDDFQLSYALDRMNTQQASTPKG